MRGEDRMPPIRVSAAKLEEATAIGADFVVTGMEEAMAAALSDDPPRALPQPESRPVRSRPRPPAPPNGDLICPPAAMIPSILWKPRLPN